MRRAPMERVRTSSSRPTSGPTIGKRRARAISSISSRTGSPSSYRRRTYSSIRGLTISVMACLLRSRTPEVQEEMAEEVRARTQEEVDEEEHGRAEPYPVQPGAVLQVHEEGDDEAGLGDRDQHRHRRVPDPEVEVAGGHRDRRPHHQ